MAKRTERLIMFFGPDNRCHHSWTLSGTDETARGLALHTLRKGEVEGAVLATLHRRNIGAQSWEAPFATITVGSR